MLSVIHLFYDIIADINAWIAEEYGATHLITAVNHQIKAFLGCVVVNDLKCLFSEALINFKKFFLDLFFGVLDQSIKVFDFITKILNLLTVFF